MIKPISKKMAEHILSRPPKVSEGDLAHLRSRVAYGRDLELKIEELQITLDKEVKKLTELRTEELPDLFEKLGLDHIGVPVEGNLPAYDAALTSYFSAVLPKEPEKLATALEFLKQIGAQDLSKTVIEIKFSRGEEKKLEKLRTALEKWGIACTSKTGVHHMVLTAWLKERFKNGKPLAQGDLEIIGASIGRVVKIEKRKEKY